MRTLELLAPAKNLEVGKAAVDHGADAVYIGANRLGARQQAGNNIEDIRALCAYAHKFGVAVHVTVNTIVFEHELEDMHRLIAELVDVGVDALLIQDMGVFDFCLRLKAERVGQPFPALHASTQCDTRTAAKVAWLYQQGFDRVVLARELSKEEMAQIHNECPQVELEAFVHGALCVSYSGVCYASEHCFHRSANRGECAQFCRLKFDLKDADGVEIEHQRHLLSLKDMCQIDHLEELAAAGASAFKIEGRLKDVDYVKNVVSAYSLRLDELVKRYPKKYRRASLGHVHYYFTPNLNKTFNRGYTDYFMNGRQPDIACFDTPKAMGEYVGKVKEIRGNSFNVAGTSTFANGDGLCFINADRCLEGFRVNRAEGNRLYPQRMPAHLHAGMALYRNNDEAFEKILAGQTAERQVQISMTFKLTTDGFALEICHPQVGSVRSVIAFEHQQARKSQHDNIVKQLTKLGGTPFICSEIHVEANAALCFVPSSLLATLRRQAVAQLEMAIEREWDVHKRVVRVVDTQKGIENDVASLSISDSDGIEVKEPSLHWQSEYEDYPYLYNISNSQAISFYEHRGMKSPAPAFEVSPGKQPLIMQCRHCIRYSLGYCVKRGGQRPHWREPLHLELPDGRRFRLEFRCQECQMNIVAESR